MYQLKLHPILYNWSWLHFTMVWIILFSETQMCSCKCLKVVVCSHLTTLSHQDMSAKLASFGTCAFFPYLFLAVLISWNTSIFSVQDEQWHWFFHHTFLPTGGCNEAFLKQPVASSLCVNGALKSKNPSAVIKWLLFWNDYIYWQGTSHFKGPTRKLALYLKDMEF